MSGFKKVVFENGTESLQDLSNGQIMHSAIGPKSEAEGVYVRPALAWFQEHPVETLTLFDVGMGTASNVLSWIELAPPELKHLTLLSFESNAEGLKTALEQKLYLTIPYRPQLEALLQHSEVNFTKNNISIDWKLLRENFLDQHELPAADLVFFDFYSPKNFPELWSVAVFEKLFNAMKSRSLLITYAATGFVKRNLKSAGFSVQSGPGTRMKRETTHAIKCTTQ